MIRRPRHRGISISCEVDRAIRFWDMGKKSKISRGRHGSRSSVPNAPDHISRPKNGWRGKSQRVEYAPRSVFDRGYHQRIFLPFMTCPSQQRITVMQSIQDRCASMDDAGRHPHHGTDVRDSWDGNPRMFLHPGCLPPMWFSLHRRARPSSPSLMDRPVFMEMQSCDNGLWGGAVVRYRYLERCEARSLLIIHISHGDAIASCPPNQLHSGVRT
jgi:hypothetical protein